MMIEVHKSYIAQCMTNIKDFTLLKLYYLLSLYMKPMILLWISILTLESIKLNCLQYNKILEGYINNGFSQEIEH